MNPNINTQIIHPFNFYIPPISSLQNPTSDDFERRFLYHKSTKTLPKSSNLKRSQSKVIFNLLIITCGKK